MYKRQPQYWTKLSDHLEQNGWDKKVDELLACIENEEPNHDLAELIDSKRIEACLLSENKLPSYRRVPWSPAIAAKQATDAILRIRLKELYTGFDHTEQMMPFMDAMRDDSIELPNNEIDCKVAIKANKSAWRAMAKDERETATERRKYQESLTDMYLEGGDKECAKIVRRIQKAEALKQVYRKLAKLRGKNVSGGLDHILVPTDPESDPTNY